MRNRRLVRSLFFALLGGVYFAAFRSLGAQVKGLYGRRGIRPIGAYLDALRPHLAPRDRLLRVPSIFWFGASDGALVRACTAGQVGAVLLALRIAPRATATALWGLYLSFVSTGREFLAFQWDVLLLENGLRAIVGAPSWLMRLLAFRLQFGSGRVKLASHDRTWRNGDACVVHFETQPLPTTLGWHAHQLPVRAKRAMTYATLAIELGAPWLAFTPRRLRRVGFALLSGLQGIIAATGNYAFFNALTIADNLWFLDRPRRAAIAAAPLEAIAVSPPDAMVPFRSLNSYGLFAVMTTSRPEIIIEGSDDAVEWKAYELPYKPGDPNRAPRWSAPHQPRLDWQMWFAALGPAPPWFMHFLARLLDGSPDVRALLAHDPFPDHPPRYVRALLYDYHFTDRETRRRTGAWWRREFLGTYVFPVCASNPSRNQR